jgi:1,4-dihydroxy-2-naphthoate octaprenyltransferase
VLAPHKETKQERIVNNFYTVVTVVTAVTAVTVVTALVAIEVIRAILTIEAKTSESSIVFKLRFIVKYNYIINP